MEFLSQALDVLVHLDKYLEWLASECGAWLYLILFLVIFCETGLVVTPILPGDSLLFGLGALAADPASGLSMPLLIFLLATAAILGDAFNYYLGYCIGPKVFRRDDSWLFNKKHLLRTQQFYERYGGKTIILARFIPIIRTFAPFVAGIGKMSYPRFATYNVVGGVAWVVICLSAGYFFGRVPFVAENFSLVILAVIIISVLPAVIEVVLARRRKPAPEPVAVEGD